MRTDERTKIRYGMVISLEEYSSYNISMVRELQAELFISSGYIGYTDVYEKTGRLFVFEGPDSRDKALKDARSIGFGSAGSVVGNVFVSNAALQRPHLQNYRSKDQFYKEYYR